MSQHDFNIANSDGATVRADINSALQAIAECSSGATAPATTFAYQWWADTANDLLKQRNAANSGWISILTLSTGAVAAGGIASVAADGSPQLGGFLDANGNYMQTEKGGDIASASPLVIDTDGDYFDVTGTTGFAAMTVAADRQFTLQFDGALTMTHHATNLDLPSEANITTAAGDVATFQSTGSNTVQCINYTKADGTGIVAAGGGKVLQVVTSERTGQTSTSSSSWVAAGVSAAITPSNSSNKVMMLCNCNGLYRSAHDTHHRLRVLVTDDVRTDSVVVTGISNMTGSQSPLASMEYGHMLQRLDSPNTTAECTYTLYYTNYSGVGTCYIAESGGMGSTTVVSMLLLEIDGT